MPTPAPLSDRVAFVDGLRALALAGVFVINALSFPHLWASSVSGIPEPIDSRTAWAVHVAAAALLQAKSYPLLAFLVGYSWGLALRGARRRGESVSAVRRRRAHRMLRQFTLGIAHGLLIFYGDILAPLALLGLWLIVCSGVRTRALLARAGGLALAWVVLNLPVSLAWLIDAGEPWPPHLLSRASSWPEVLALQAEAYAGYLAGLPLFLPMLAAFGTLGVAAARLRLLEHRRWRRWWCRVTWALLPAGLALNVAHAWWVTPFGPEAAIDPARQDAAMQFLGPPLAAGFVGALWMLRHAGRARWLTVLAPAGRMTMSLYVAGHAVFLLLLAGPGLALAPSLGSVGLGALGAGWWLVALVLGAWWTGRFGAGLA